MDAASSASTTVEHYVCGCLRLHALRPLIVHGEERRGREWVGGVEKNYFSEGMISLWFEFKNLKPAKL